MQLDHIDFNTLISNAKQSEDGFAEFLRSIQPYILNKARYLLESDEEAEDIFQNISLKLYRNLDNLNPNYFMRYLKNSVTNACIDVTRKRNVKTEDGYDINLVEIDALENFDIPDENQSGIDLTEEYRRDIINEVIDTLPDNQKQVIVMRYMDELKIKEIAEQLNVNENTVKSRLNLSYKKIKEEVLRIQKRDGIKLYSYSPVMFFLLLLRGRGQQPNNFMIDKVIENLTNNNPAGEVTRKIISTVESTASQITEAEIATTTAATTGAAAVIKNAADEVARKIISATETTASAAADAGIATTTGVATSTAATAAAAKVSLGLSTKVIAGVLAGLLTVGGIGYGVSTLSNFMKKINDNQSSIVIPNNEDSQTIINDDQVENDNQVDENGNQSEQQQNQTEIIPAEDENKSKPIGSVVASVFADDCCKYVDLDTYNWYKINIREGYSTSARKVGVTEPRTRYNVYDIKENEGYTWYRISSLEHVDRWIANNGEWLAFSNEISDICKYDFGHVATTVVGNKGSRKIGPYVLSYGKYYPDAIFEDETELLELYIEFIDDHTVHIHDPEDVLFLRWDADGNHDDLSVDKNYTYTIEYRDPAVIAKCEADGVACYIRSPENGVVAIWKNGDPYLHFELVDNNTLGADFIGFMYVAEPGEYSSIYLD